MQSIMLSGIDEILNAVMESKEVRFAHCDLPNDVATSPVVRRTAGDESRATLQSHLGTLLSSDKSETARADQQ